jgi:tetratricopeptide (TPR) repeat protein
VNGQRFRPLIAGASLVAIAIFAVGIWLLAHGLAHFQQQRSTIAQTTTTPLPAPTANVLPAATVAAPSPTVAATPEDSNIKEAQNYIQRAQDHYKKQDWDGALADLNRALELDPKSSNAYNDRGLVKKAKHDLEGAAADYSKAIELNPKDATALSNLGVIKLDSSEVEAAIIYFDRALKIEPTRIGTLVLRGDAKTAQEDLRGRHHRLQSRGSARREAPSRDLSSRACRNAEQTMDGSHLRFANAL